ncbi:MAG: hypothetical protein QM731_25000 [Chitinophagaceae bacterium]
MGNTITYRWTGFWGITLYLLVLLEIPFYFVYTPTPAGTPPPSIILIRILIDLFVCVGLLAFFSGLRSILTQSHPEYNWLTIFIFANGLAFPIVALVADSIQAGSVWAAGVKPVNPTWVGYGAEGALLIYGPVNRLLTATLLIALGTFIIKTRFLPKWTGWLAYIISLYNIAFIPTLFYVTTPLDFYSVNGWNIPIAAGYFFLWIFIISICLLRKK